MRRRGKRIHLCTGLPRDMLAGGFRITLLSMKAVLVEGQRGVVELSETRIRIKTEEGILIIDGKGMQLRELSVDAAMICSDHIHAVSCAC